MPCLKKPLFSLYIACIHFFIYIIYTPLYFYLVYWHDTPHAFYKEVNYDLKDNAKRPCSNHMFRNVTDGLLSQ